MQTIQSGSNIAKRQMYFVCGLLRLTLFSKIMIKSLNKCFEKYEFIQKLNIETIWGESHQPTLVLDWHFTNIKLC